MNNHGPSLVPCGMPVGTGPHSEKHTNANLIHWDLSNKKSIIQLIMVAGNLHWLRNFLTSKNWIPSKWGMFGGHLGDFNCISSNWGTCGRDFGNVNWILSKLGTSW